MRDQAATAGTMIMIHDDWGKLTQRCVNTHQGPRKVHVSLIYFTCVINLYLWLCQSGCLLPFDVLKSRVMTSKIVVSFAQQLNERIHHFANSSLRALILQMLEARQIERVSSP
uniref:Uncharacterized protein n=1 Tax=Glossina austeni TaxID=7395 RepID=A0A1A9VYM6_GLOAU